MVSKEKETRNQPVFACEKRLFIRRRKKEEGEGGGKGRVMKKKRERTVMNE